MINQMILVVACSIFAIGFATITVKYILVKREVRQIKKNLEKILATETNAHLQTSTFDRDMVALAESMNVLLEKTRKDYLKMLQTETDLKRAITNISHDLRTPLTSAKGYLQMIEEGLSKVSKQIDEKNQQKDRSQEEKRVHLNMECQSNEMSQFLGGTNPIDEECVKRYHQIIRGRLDALTELLDSLFNFSRAIEGDLKIEKVDISYVLRETLLNNYLELESRGFTVDSEIPETPIYCQGDEEAMERIFQNLIKNAYVHGTNKLNVKLLEADFAWSGSEFHKECKKLVGDKKSEKIKKERDISTPKNVRIEIANEIEYPDEIDIHAIFQRFYTADAARTNKRTGLGLAIVKELTEKMGGSISAEVNGRRLVFKILLNGL